MNECLGKACMADKEWPSVDPKERVCIQCPRYAGNNSPSEAHREALGPISHKAATYPRVNEETAVELSEEEEHDLQIRYMLSQLSPETVERLNKAWKDVIGIQPLKGPTGKIFKMKV